MADQKLTQLPILASASTTDLLYIVDVSDTSQSPQGTSKKIQVSGIGANKADLVDGKVPLNQIPAGAINVITYANDTLFPPVGAFNTIYISIGDNYSAYWDGAEYQLVGGSGGGTYLVSGETSNATGVLTLTDSLGETTVVEGFTKLADSIVDSVIDTAPTQNAVYDALLLKANQAAFVSHTGNTNNPHQTTAAQIAASAHTIFLTGTTVQAQLDNTEDTSLLTQKVNKTNFKNLYQTGLLRTDADVSVVSTASTNTLQITAVDRILFINEINIDLPTNRIPDVLKDFGTIIFTMNSTNTPLSANTRGIFYLGVDKLGTQVYRVQRTYDQDVCYLARVLVQNTAGVYSIINFKYYPDIANNNPIDKGRSVNATGILKWSGSASISFGNVGVTLHKDSVNYSNNHSDPNYLVVPDSVGTTPTNFVFILPNIGNLATPLTTTTTINPTVWYQANGTAGAGAVGGANYQVYRVLISVQGIIQIQTLASTTNAPQAGVNAIFGNRDDALAGLTSVVFPLLSPVGDVQQIGTFYLRAGTNPNGSQMNDPADFYYLPVATTSSSSSVGATTHDELSGKNDNPTYQHVTATDIINWNQIVQQSITDGVTGSSPSQDVVFDALALKQNVITNPVSGLGTANTLSKWSGTTGLTNSSITDSGTIVSFNNSGAVLVGTTDNAVDRLQVGGPAISTAWKTSGGTSAEYVKGDGTLGFLSGITGGFDVFVTGGTLVNDTTTFTNNTGGTFTVTGYASNISASQTQSGIVDNNPLQELGGVDKLINGVRIGKGDSFAITNTVLGVDAGTDNSVGGGNLFLGYNAGINNFDGSDNLFLGLDAGKLIGDNITPNTSANNSIFLGTRTKPLGGVQTNQIVIGFEAIGEGSNSVVLGNSGITKTILKGNTLIGTSTDNGVDKLQVNGSLIATSIKKLGGTNTEFLMADGSVSTGGTGSSDTYVTGGTYSSGTTIFMNNTGGTFNVTGYTNPLKYYSEPATPPTTPPIATGVGAIAIGDGAFAHRNNMIAFGVSAGAGAGASSSFDAILIGTSAGSTANNTNNTILIGTESGYGTVSPQNSTYIGKFAGKNSTTLTNSNVIGYSAGLLSNYSNQMNIIGYNAGQNLINCDGSVMIGNGVGVGGSDIDNSIYLGNNAGFDTTLVTYSNLIGYNAGSGLNNASYSNFIGYNAGASFLNNNLSVNNIIIGTNITLPNTSTNRLNLGGIIFGFNTYATTGGNPAFTASTGGRISIGTHLDNGTDRLQVAGTAISTAWRTSGGTAAQYVKGDGTLGTISSLTAITAPDVFVTAGTYSNGTAVFTNTTGGTFNVTGFNTGSTPTPEIFVTAGTYSNGTAVFTNTTGGTFNVTGFATGTSSSDIFVTGGTYAAGTTTFRNNSGGTFDVTGYNTNNGTVDGLGTLNHLSKWGSVSGLTNSIVIDNGTNVSIGGTSASGVDRLQVAGSVIAQTLKISGGTASQFLMADGSTSIAGSAGVGGAGTINYVPKWSTTSNLSNSNIADNGTRIGLYSALGTGSTADLSFGSQSNRTLGIDYTTVGSGKSLTIVASTTLDAGSAGVSANTETFTIVDSNTRTWRGITIAPNGDVYASNSGGDIYKRAGGVGAFVALGQTNRNWYGMASNNAGDIFVCNYGAGNGIYKQVGGVGSFVLYDGGKDYLYMTVTPNNDIYATVNGGDIYKQTNSTGPFVALGQTARLWRGINYMNGDMYVCVESDGVYKQTASTGPFVKIYSNAAEYFEDLTSIGNVLYAAGNAGLYKSADNGITWGVVPSSNASCFGAGSRNYNLYTNGSNFVNYSPASITGGGTNNAGGALNLQTGIGVGTANTSINFITATPAATSGQVQTSSTKMTLDGNGKLNLIGSMTVSSAITTTVMSATTYLNLPAGSGTVTSVNGQSGIVVLASSDIAENSATNRWYTPARESAKVSTTTTIGTTAPLVGGGSLAGNLTLSMPAASASIHGYLTSTDWVIFNSKSALKYYAEPVALPTVAPVSSGSKAIAIGDGAVAAGGNFIAIGTNAGSGATGGFSTHIGNGAGIGSSNSNTTISLGYQAGQFAPNGIANTFIGVNSGKNASGATESAMIGGGAGDSSNTSISCVFLGQLAGYHTANNTNSVFIGKESGSEATSSNNSVFIGRLAGSNGIGNASCIFIGQQAGINSPSTSYANYIGYNAGSGTTSSYSNLFGYKAGVSVSGLDEIGVNNIIIGTNISLPNASTNKINLGGVIFGHNTYGTTTGDPSQIATATGRVSLGSHFDNGTDRLQVAGTAIAANWKTSGGTASQFVRGDGTLALISSISGGGGSIGGSGTANTIPKWSSTTGLTNSLITDNGTAVTVGGNLTATSIIRNGGTSAQFLKADGSIDINSYALASSLHNPVTLGTPNGLSLSTQVLSLALASTSTVGALSSTDWNTFNGKQNVLPAANTSTNGYLSSTDWNTFNGKQNVIANNITGSGTANYMSKFTAGGVIGNSIVYDTGTYVGIGHTAPTSKLDINNTGNINLTLRTSVAGAAIYQEWRNSAGTRRGYLGFTTPSGSNLQLANEDGGDIVLDATRTLVGYLSNEGRTQRLQVLGDVFVSGLVTASSDARLKTNIQPLTNSLEKVLSLKGVKFDRTDTKATNQIGFIAQELETVIPELVSTDSSDEGMKSVNYQAMVAVLVEAMKEQNELIVELNNRILKLENK